MKNNFLSSDIEQLLERLPVKITPVEREVLLNKEMTQAEVSAILKVPVKVEVIAQHDIADVIVRQVRIYVESAEGKKSTAYIAESIIPVNKNSEKFISIIREKKMGIGQAINAMRIVQERHIIDLYADENVILRNYSITGDGLFVLITETFPRKVLNGQ